MNSQGGCGKRRVVVCATHMCGKGMISKGGSLPRELSNHPPTHTHPAPTPLPIALPRPLPHQGAGAAAAGVGVPAHGAAGAAGRVA